MTEHDLEASVAAELRWDPKVESRQIIVSASGGAVTLHGAVGSLRQKFEARQAAKRVRGVTSVNDQLIVLIPVQDRPGDAKLRADVLEALALNSTIPASADARVQDGLVTLTGAVAFRYQREEAERVCVSVPGALGISDEITLIPVRHHVDIQQAICEAFRRSARLAKYGLSVAARADGTVILSGVVTSWAEHDEAIAAAWSAPGVSDVDDRVIVAYLRSRPRRSADRRLSAPAGPATKPPGPGRSQTW
jgi:osmotically-inducible protein OsmY